MRSSSTWTLNQTNLISSYSISCRWQRCRNVSASGPLTSHMYSRGHAWSARPGGPVNCHIIIINYTDQGDKEGKITPMVYVRYCTSDLLGDTAASLQNTVRSQFGTTRRRVCCSICMGGKFHVGLDFLDSRHASFRVRSLPPNAQRTTHPLVLHFWVPVNSSSWSCPSTDPYYGILCGSSPD